MGITHEQVVSHDPLTTGPLIGILDLLQASSQGGAQTAVIEHDYTDPDHADAYARFYSHSFTDYRRRCTRFHFFSCTLEKDDFVSSVEADGEAWERLRSNYLGFVVIRPSNPDTVGQSCLPTPLSSSEIENLVRPRRFPVNLAGVPLLAMGAPFIEQDQKVAACATAAVWMAHRLQYDELSLPDMSCTDITELGTKDFPQDRGFPSEGLTIEQMAASLAHMGYDPYTYVLRQKKIPFCKRMLFSFVHAGIPVLLGLAAEQGPHAITVVGHRMASPSTISTTLGMQETNTAATNGYYYEYSDFAEVFLAHDDSLGPYREMVIEEAIPWPEDSYLRDERFKGFPAFRLREGYGITPEKELYSGLIVGAIVPLVKGLYLLPEQALSKSLSCLTLFSDLLEPAPAGVLPRAFVIRGSLITRNALKSALSSDRGMPRDLVARYRHTLMPKYLWLWEILGLDEWLVHGDQGPVTFGEVLLDVSSSPGWLDFVAMHISGYFAYMQQWENKPGSVYEAMKRGIEEGKVSEWAPYPPVSVVEPPINSHPFSTILSDYP